MMHLPGPHRNRLGPQEVNKPKSSAMRMIFFI
jgi:hypothetical protein